MKLSLHGPIITADPGILNGRNLSIKLPQFTVPTLRNVVFYMINNNVNFVSNRDPKLLVQCQHILSEILYGKSKIYLWLDSTTSFLKCKLLCQNKEEYFIGLFET